MQCMGIGGRMDSDSPMATEAYGNGQDSNQFQGFEVLKTTKMLSKRYQSFKHLKFVHSFFMEQRRFPRHIYVSASEFARFPVRSLLDPRQYIPRFTLRTGNIECSSSWWILWQLFEGASWIVFDEFPSTFFNFILVLSDHISISVVSKWQVISKKILKDDWEVEKFGKIIFGNFSISQSICNGPTADPLF